MVCQVLPDDIPEACEVDGGPGRYLPTAQPNTCWFNWSGSGGISQGASGENRRTGLKYPHISVRCLASRAGRVPVSRRRSLHS